MPPPVRRSASCLSVGLVLLVLAGGLPSAAREGENGALSLVEATMREGMARLGLSASDVVPRHDFIPADRWRVPLVDRCLEAPLTAARTAHAELGAWIRTEEALPASLARALQSLGRRVEPPPTRTVEGGDPYDGLASLFEGRGVEPPEAAEVRDALRAVPAEARSFLAALLRAVAEAVALRERAFAELSEAEWVELRKFGSQFNTGMPPHLQVSYLQRYHARIDESAIADAALRVASVLERADALPRALRGRRKAFHLHWDTPCGRVEIGGFGPNRYEEDALLVVDLGGDDVHANSAGGTLYTPHKISICVDLGGDDRYETDVGLAQGSGMYGVGMLVDVAGDDSYVTARNVSQGAGHVGVGVLWDLAGNDRYRAGRVSQGAGFQGVGLLRDDAGADTYEVGFMGQGFGGTQGIGILRDGQGDDRYVAGGLVADVGRDPDHFLSLAQGHGQGNRAESLEHCTSGGVGLLADVAGDDRYEADVFAQGCAYWYALGVLLDGAGNDVYRIHNYGQGGGFHMAVGVHLELGGDDEYRGPHHAQGHALDRSVGWLVDYGGDDTYAAESESQGSAVKPYAVAFFADLGGDDAYRGGTPAYVRVPVEGPEDPEGPEDLEGPWPKAFFLDLGGKDEYAPALAGYAASVEGSVSDGATWIVNGHGWGSDREVTPPGRGRR